MQQAWQLKVPMGANFQISWNSNWFPEHRDQVPGGNECFVSWDVWHSTQLRYFVFIPKPPKILQPGVDNPFSMSKYVQVYHIRCHVLGTVWVVYCSSKEVLSFIKCWCMKTNMQWKWWALLVYTYICNGLWKHQWFWYWYRTWWCQEQKGCWIQY